VRSTAGSGRINLCAAAGRRRPHFAGRGREPSQDSTVAILVMRAAAPLPKPTPPALGRL